MNAHKDIVGVVPMNETHDVSIGGLQVNVVWKMHSLRFIVRAATMPCTKSPGEECTTRCGQRVRLLHRGINC